MKKVVQSLSAVLLMSSIVTGSAMAEGVFHIRTGTFTMSDAQQYIFPVNVTFDDSSSSPFSLEYETLDAGKTSGFGLELISYSNDITAGASGSADTIHLMLNYRKYFDVSKNVKPYVGAGFGSERVAAATMAES